MEIREVIRGNLKELFGEFPFRGIQVYKILVSGLPLKYGILLFFGDFFIIG